MIHYAGRLFSLRRQEIAPTALLFFYLFLVTGAYLMGQAVGDALFLHVFPTHLPYAMIGSAAMAGVFVAIYIRLAVRMRLERLIIAALLFFAFSFALFWWLAQGGAQWAYLLVLIWVYAAGAICPMMGWTLAHYTLTTREARRVFGFIGAGALLGGAMVSFTAADMLHDGQIRPQTALLGIALMLVCCTILVRLLFWNNAHRLAVLSQDPAAAAETPKNFTQSLKLIRGSRYLLLLTGLVAIGCLATCILGYQFKLIAKASYGDDTVGLANFFCRFNGYMGLASFVFQLVLTPPLLRTFGIRVTLFVVPVALMGSSIGVLLAPTLLMGGILRATHYVLRFSLDKSSTELLYLPVSPEIRSQVKSFIDTFVWRSADGIAGLTLLFSANVLKLDPNEVSLVNLLVLAGWIAIANGVRREYLNVLREAIDCHSLDPERTAAQVLDSTTNQVLAQALEHGGEQQILYGMSLFEMGRHAGWHPALRNLLEHRSPAVRWQALRLLEDAGDGEILPAMEKLLGDESLEVRAEALRYLVVHEGREPLSLLTEHGHLPAQVLQGAVVTYLMRNGEQDYSAAAEMILQGMLTQVGPEAAQVRCEAARVLGVIPSTSPLQSRLGELLGDENPEVVEQALRSTGRCRSPGLLPRVIDNLGRPRQVAAASAALVQYGAVAVKPLQLRLNDKAVPLSLRKRIPPILAHIPTPESASVLAHSLIQSDAGLRFDILKALNKLRDLDPALTPTDVDYTTLVHAELIGYYRSFQILAALDPAALHHGENGPTHSSERLLQRACQERMEHRLERIFRLLALLHSQRDVYNAFVGLASGRPQLQANALEVLEHILPPALFRSLANVLDPEVGLRQKLDYARRLCQTEVASRSEALRILLYSEDSWMRACALYAAGGLGRKELIADMNRISCDHDPLLAETRNWALARFAERSPA